MHAKFTMLIERLIHKKPSEHLHFQKFLSKLDFMPVLDNLVNWTKRFLSGFLKTKIDPWHHHQEMKDSSFCELDLPIFSHPLTYSSSVHIESEQLQGPGSQLAAQRARPKSRLSRSLCWFKSNLFSAAQVPAHRLNQKPSSAIFFLSDQGPLGISCHRRTYSKTFCY